MNTQTRLVRPLRNGQITLPAPFRRTLRLDEAPMLQVTLGNGELHIRAYDPDKLPTGSEWLRDLYGLYAPVRRSLARQTEQDIDAAIDRIIAFVRISLDASRRS